MAIEGKGHGATRHRSSQTHLPEKLSIARVQGKEVAFSSSSEEDIRSRREHAALSVVVHLELPLLFAGLRFDSDDGSVAFLVLAESRGISVSASGQAAAAMAWPLLRRAPAGWPTPVYLSPSTHFAGALAEIWELFCHEGM